MYPFNAPVSDILFSLKHIAGPAIAHDMDEELARDILDLFGQFAAEELAPTNMEGDQIGAKLVDGRVVLPDSFVAAYQAHIESGWQGLSIPEAFEGTGASPILSGCVSEIFSGANHALQMICNLVPGASHLLLHHGSNEQQNHWLPKLASGEYLATMCLTEADAGSDLSAIRCAAKKVDGAWQIDGEKIFISGGDQNISAGILHFVLARSGPSDSGVKGLSLFLCPAQEGVQVRRIEEKMGLHASPTCHMGFDAATAELIGEEGAGLAAMFAMMNHARIDVALQGVAHSARAWDIAQTYAKERIQGRDKNRQPAQIFQHADVQRMLNRQRMLALTSRSTCHLALLALEQEELAPLAAFLTPICKIMGSEAGIEAADLGIQILGGYGYLEEYGMSQVWRDARVTAIYEGANGIHARALATREIREDQGVDQFADLLRGLSDQDATLLADIDQWRTHVDTLRNDAAAEAQSHSFAQSSISLLQRVLARKYTTEAANHPDPSSIPTN